MLIRYFYASLMKNSMSQPTKTINLERRLSTEELNHLARRQTRILTQIKEVEAKIASFAATKKAEIKALQAELETVINEFSAETAWEEILCFVHHDWERKEILYINVETGLVADVKPISPQMIEKWLNRQTELVDEYKKDQVQRQVDESVDEVVAFFFGKFATDEIQGSPDITPEMLTGLEENRLAYISLVCKHLYDTNKIPVDTEFDVAFEIGSGWFNRFKGALHVGKVPANYADLIPKPETPAETTENSEADNGETTANISGEQSENEDEQPSENVDKNLSESSVVEHAENAPDNTTGEKSSKEIPVENKDDLTVNPDYIKEKSEFANLSEEEKRRLYDGNWSASNIDEKGMITTGPDKGRIADSEKYKRWIDTVQPIKQGEATNEPRIPVEGNTLSSDDVEYAENTNELLNIFKGFDSHIQNKSSRIQQIDQTYDSNLSELPTDHFEKRFQQLLKGKVEFRLAADRDTIRVIKGDKNFTIFSDDLYGAYCLFENLVQSVMQQAYDDMAKPIDEQPLTPESIDQILNELPPINLAEGEKKPEARAKKKRGSSKTKNPNDQ